MPPSRTVRALVRAEAEQAILDLRDTARDPESGHSTTIAALSDDDVRALAAGVLGAVAAVMQP